MDRSDAEQQEGVKNKQKGAMLLDFTLWLS